MTKQRTNILEAITGRFITMLEEGLADPHGWVRPWHRIGSVARNAQTGKAYKGINQLWFSLVAEEAGSLPVFATYKQWEGLGCQVSKGSTSTQGVKWVQGQDREVKKADGTTETKRGNLFPTGFAVFHASQVEDAEEGSGAKSKVLDRFKPVELTDLQMSEAAQVAENTLLAYTGAQGITVTSKGNRAFYSPSADGITMPPRKQFKTSSGYVSTLGHECVHSTGAAKRLDREGITGSDFHGPKYAFEELVAEIGAAGLCDILGIDDEPREDHAHYLANWLELLNNDRMALHRACSQSDKAVGFILEVAGVDANRDVEPAEVPEPAAV